MLTLSLIHPQLVLAGTGPRNVNVVDGTHSVPTKTLNGFERQVRDSSALSHTHRCYVMYL